MDSTSVENEILVMRGQILAKNACQYTSLPTDTCFVVTFSFRTNQEKRADICLEVIRCGAIGTNLGAPAKTILPS
jgi:hypothetical protein